MLLAWYARRGALRGESMPDRAGINGGGQLARVHPGMARGQLFRILGQDTPGRRGTPLGHSQSLAIRKHLIVITASLNN